MTAAHALIGNIPIKSAVRINLLSNLPIRGSLGILIIATQWRSPPKVPGGGMHKTSHR
jgi:hypothetical protein